MADIFGLPVFETERAAGQEVVVGLTWEMLILGTTIAFFAFLLHFIIRDVLNPTGHTAEAGEATQEEIEESLRSQGVEEVQRFTLAQRASHWVMAISIFLLMLSGFVMMYPDITLEAVAGIAWVDIHIIFSVVLIGYVFFHLGHVAYRGTWWNMWFGIDDAKDQLVRFKNLIGLTDEYPRQKKYPSAQKMLHTGVTFATIGVIITGLVMSRRVSIPYLWEETREFTFLGIEFTTGFSQDGWGLIDWSFVLHDAFAILLVMLVLGHVYFALRPREWGVTKSMFTGSVSVETYAEKYSPKSWQVEGVPTADGGEHEEETSDDEAKQS